MLRSLVCLLLAAVLAGCISDGGVGERPLDAELLPFDAAAVEFRVDEGGVRILRLENTDDPDVADLVVTGDGLDEQRMKLRRGPTAIWFSNGPQDGTELIRFGARPGDAWRSGPDEIHFEGWERVSVPAGTYDTARLSSRRGSETLQLRQTWWFAAGVGIVRVRDDRGGLIVSDLVRVSP